MGRCRVPFDAMCFMKSSGRHCENPLPSRGIRSQPRLPCAGSQLFPGGVGGAGHSVAVLAMALTFSARQLAAEAPARRRGNERQSGRCSIAIQQTPEQGSDRSTHLMVMAAKLFGPGRYQARELHGVEVLAAEYDTGDRACRSNVLQRIPVEQDHVCNRSRPDDTE